MQLSLLILLSLLSVVGAQAPLNDSRSLLWGTYRPNLYFGLRPRLPKSLMTGLMWYGVQDYQSFTKIRHACEQGDGLKTYTWTEHDMRDGGVQVLKDEYNNLDLRIEWLKMPGGESGGSWAARISGQALDESRPSKYSIISYFGLEGFGGLNLENEKSPDGLKGTVELTGKTTDLGGFHITLEDGPSNTHITRGRHYVQFLQRSGNTQFVGHTVPDGTIWQAKDYMSKTLMQTAEAIVQQYGGETANRENLPEPAFLLTLTNTASASANLYAFQKTFEGPFSFDIYYDADDVKQKFDAETLTIGLKAFTDSYDSRFNMTFPVPAASPPSLLAFSKAVTANLLGGIGYFYGTSIVDRAVVHDWDDEEGLAPEQKTQAPTLADAKGLLTATPSRSFFPRGFYWDEGFHLIHIGAWDNDLSLEILKDWINLIDDDGWVGREQILGEEARSKVPPEFQTQYPTYANPPTLAMAVTAFIERLKSMSDPLSDQLNLDQLGLGGSQLPLMTASTPAPDSSTRLLRNPELAREYLVSIYPALRKHYLWFKRTQRGQIKQWGREATSRSEGYRWRGRTPDHVLTSGLDDYPRARPPHVGELHLDLISWMGFFSRTMKQIAGFLGESDDEAEYATAEKNIIANIDDLHWNEEEQMYCDASVNAEDESYHVCHKGYISLFPFMLGLLPSSSPHLGAILDIVESPDHLWSPYGIRSLSASHPLFGKDENYWRGAVWMQMNYLALAALHKKYAAEEGPYQAQAREIYNRLRENIIQNVHKEYERTGYVWEQYDAITGEGRRSHPFTGWTSLVTLIISEIYPGL